MCSDCQCTSAHLLVLGLCSSPGLKNLLPLLLHNRTSGVQAGRRDVAAQLGHQAPQCLKHCCDVHMLAVVLLTRFKNR